jgi:hypothetical protein
LLPRERSVERTLEVELTDHLGYEPHQGPPGGAGDTRNGKGKPKTLITEHGPVQIRAPRDRDGSFEPQLVRKRQRRFEGFDEKILALYSRGLSTRDIERYLRELYGVNVGRELISRVTGAPAWDPLVSCPNTAPGPKISSSVLAPASSSSTTSSGSWRRISSGTVMDDARAWQQRPLDDVYLTATTRQPSTQGLELTTGQSPTHLPGHPLGAYGWLLLGSGW